MFIDLHAGPDHTKIAGECEGIYVAVGPGGGLAHDLTQSVVFDKTQEGLGVADGPAVRDEHDLALEMRLAGGNPPTQLLGFGRILLIRIDYVRDLHPGIRGVVCGQQVAQDGMIPLGIPPEVEDDAAGLGHAVEQGAESPAKWPGPDRRKTHCFPAPGHWAA